MKKLSLFLLIIMLIVACKKSDEPKPNNLSNSSTNNPPVLQSNLSYTDTLASTLQIDLSNKISSTNGNTWSITNATAPHGTVIVSGKTINYTPNSGYTGNDTISISIQDSKGATSTGKIVASVSASTTTSTNHAPTFTSTSTTLGYDDITHVLNKSFVLPVLDSDGDNISITSIKGDTSNVSISYSGLNITATPVNSVYAGIDTLQITISDGKATTTSSFIVNIGSQSQIDAYNILSQFFDKPLNGIRCNCAQGQYTVLKAGTITLTATQYSGEFFDYPASAGTYNYTISSGGYITFTLSSATSITYNPPIFQTGGGVNYLVLDKANNCLFSPCDTEFTLY